MGGTSALDEWLCASLELDNSIELGQVKRYIITVNVRISLSDRVTNLLTNMVYVRVETGSGHPGQPGHILSRSSGSDPFYKISGSDLDYILYHVC